MIEYLRERRIRLPAAVTLEKVALATSARNPRRELILLEIRFLAAIG